MSAATRDAIIIAGDAPPGSAGAPLDLVERAVILYVAQQLPHVTLSEILITPTWNRFAARS